MKTIEYWNNQKRHLMRVLRYARIINSKKGIETYSKAVNKCDLKIGVISLMKRLVVLGLLACLFMAGCTASVGGGASVSAYYPKGWESPASREQHTQPTIGLGRNNLPMVNGGAR